MFYAGRICGLFLIVFLLFFHDTNKEHTLVYTIVISLFVLFIVWLGIQYDKVNMDKKKREETEKKLKESEERYRNLVEISPISIVVHQHGKILYVNPTTIETIQAKDSSELIGKTIYDFIHPDYHDITKIRLSEVTDGKHIRFTEQKLIRLDGEVIDVEVSAFEITYLGQKSILSLVNDITDRKTAEKQMYQMAYHDTLTNLPNRYYLEVSIEEALQRARVQNQKLAIMFIDLDRFKMINDSLGHGFGDLLLQQVAERLKHILREEDQIFRYAGDEFVIVLENTNQEKVKQVASRILGKFELPFVIHHQEVFSSPSIGISMYPKDGIDKETLIKNADAAIYFAKTKGKNNYQFYTSAFNDRFLQKINLENDLRKALDRNEFFLVYQPQVNLSSEEMVGLEALIRWKHPSLGMVSPSTFIPLAEETGLIISIGHWVLKTAIKQTKLWQEAGFPSIRVAVNISVRQFQDPHFVKTVVQALEETHLEPTYLDLEITESVMQNMKESIVLLQKLKKIGVYLSIDDFGTGYSSLSLLKDLPIDNLKIDQSFVHDLMNHVHALDIVKTIIDMGRNLKLEVIAEGIENERQLSMLKKIKCTYGQGYYFSQPLTVEEVEHVLKGKNSLSFIKEKDRDRA